ncbi:MAG: hypothetical protein ACREFN_17485 [Acetobacteraceae bacterium]
MLTLSANGLAIIGPCSPTDMSRIQVALRVNGEPVLERHGGHPVEDQLTVAVILPNMMREADGVKAAQIVAAGSWTGLLSLKLGYSCAVHFEKLGAVEAFIEDWAATGDSSARPSGKAGCKDGRTRKCPVRFYRTGQVNREASRLGDEGVRRPPTSGLAAGTLPGTVVQYTRLVPGTHNQQ